MSPLEILDKINVKLEEIKTLYLIENQYSNPKFLLQGNLCVGDLLKVALLENDSFYNIFIRLNKFNFLGFKLPSIDIENFKSTEIDQDDLIILSENLDGKYPWCQKNISPLHIFCSSRVVKESISGTIQKFEKFSMIGIELPNLPSEWLDDLEEKDFIALYTYRHGKIAWDTKTCKVNFLETAIVLEESVTQVYRRLEKFKKFNLHLPNLNLELAENIFIFEEDLNILYKFYGSNPTKLNLESLKKSKNLEERFFLDCIPLVHCLYISVLILKESIFETIKRLQKLRFLNLKFTDFNLESVQDLNVSFFDCILLLRDFDSNKSDILKSEIPYTQIIIASGLFQESLGETIKRFQKLTPLGIILPDRIDKDIENYKPKQEDIILISEQLDFTGFDLLDENNKFYEKAWINNNILTIHIVQTAAHLEKSIEDILNQLSHFVSLGLKLPEMNAEFLKNFIPTQEDMIIFSKNLDGDTPLLKKKVSTIHIIKASLQLQEPLATTLQRIQRFISLGLDVPETDPQLLGDFTVIWDDLITLSQDLDGTEPCIEEEITCIHLLRVSMWLEKPVRELRDRMEKLTSLGYIVPQIDPELLQDLIVTQTDLIILSEDLDAASPWLEGEVDSSHIVHAAYRLEKPRQTILETLQRYAPILNLKLPEGDPETWDF